MKEKAQRYNAGKRNWIILDGYFESAQEAEYLCREYGVEKYTDEEKGIDGLTNWMSSMGTEHHDEFMYGCLESANRHLLELRRGEQIDEESGKPHVGFVRLNMGMYQAYFMYSRNEDNPLDSGDFIEKCPNLTRRKEMPEWLIDLIYERMCNFENHNKQAVTSMFTFRETKEGRDFWDDVSDWQYGSCELPERPNT